MLATVCCSNHCLPLEVAHYRYHHIQTVQSSLEGYTLYYIQIATYYIYDYPERPLLYVFACQCPQADEAKGIGEGVKSRNE